LQAANAARTVAETAVRASEALNASLMAENAELRRSSAAMQEKHSAAMQEAHAAAGAAASGDADDAADEIQRYQLHP
jgi:hypothetical protein